jgi:hypothetical protein
MFLLVFGKIQRLDREARQGFARREGRFDSLLPALLLF